MLFYSECIYLSFLGHTRTNAAWSTGTLEVVVFCFPRQTERHLFISIKRMCADKIDCRADNVCRDDSNKSLYLMSLHSFFFFFNVRLVHALAKRDLGAKNIIFKFDSLSEQWDKTNYSLVFPGGARKSDLVLLTSNHSDVTGWAIPLPSLSKYQPCVKAVTCWTDALTFVFCFSCPAKKKSICDGLSTPTNQQYEAQLDINSY